MIDDARIPRAADEEHDRAPIPRWRAGAAVGRMSKAAGSAAVQEAEACGTVRRERQRRQGRCDRADHPARPPTHLARRGAAGAVRPRLQPERRTPHAAALVSRFHCAVRPPPIGSAAPVASMARGWRKPFQDASNPAAANAAAMRRPMLLVEPATMVERQVVMRRCLRSSPCPAGPPARGGHAIPVPGVWGAMPAWRAGPR